jgi:hypothetical protein
VTALPGLTDETHAVPFRDFDISEAISSGLEAAGIFTTFPIQALTLPLALGGQDIIGQARTGTGKTLAFGVPLLQLIEEHGQSRLPQALVVVPTRELAIQVADDLRVAAVNVRVKVLTVYGGRAYEPQIDALTAGVDIVVGTPGRLLDLAERRHLDLSAVRALVLDEADKMLDLGFLPDVERIVRLTPAQRQTMLFSATMPGDVVTLARRHMRQPTNIRAEGHDAPAPVPSTEQHVFRAHQMDKIEVLARVLQARNRGLTIVFCQTKRAADQVATALASRGFAVATVHGDLGQGQRERALRPGRPGRRRRHVRRLAGHAPLEAHRRGAGPGHGRASGDVLHLGAPVHRTGHPARGDRDAPPRDAGPGRAGGRGCRGHRRDRQDPLAPARVRGPGLQSLWWPRWPEPEEHRRRDGPGRRHRRAAAPPDPGGPRGRRGGIRRTAPWRGPGRSGAVPRAGSEAAPSAADVRP